MSESSAILEVCDSVDVCVCVSHENIIGLVDILPPHTTPWDDLYIVTDLMETDLHRIIYSKQSLSIDHVQYFVYQVNILPIHPHFRPPTDPSTLTSTHLVSITHIHSPLPTHSPNVCRSSAP